MMRRPSLSPSNQILKAYFHSKILVSNSDFDGGDNDLDGASSKYERSQLEVVTHVG
ncbi:hypothetical protein E1A91_A05G298000v1 [Gossypium mustelinum]|uniref:Uncharacterized protein n=1 Tax=Gossypium mustelinum TaxID=34275 RepID=A0A5D2ZB43_GOSMU|nr:hypothetical protein E1A91_A05G298000v1 [Gossypium mustelinum]